MTAQIGAFRSRVAQKAALITLSWCLAIFSLFISMNLNGRFQHRAETISNEFAILHGTDHVYDGVVTPEPQMQSRILFPAILSVASRVVRPSVAYALLRFLSAWAAFAIFMLATKADVRLAAIGAALLAYALVFTFNHGWEHPTDFFDVLFFSAFLRLTLDHRRTALFLTTLLATLNHSTAAFAAFLWFFVWREYIFSGVLAISSFALTMTLTRVLAVTKRSYVFNGYLTFTQLADALKHPSLSMWPLLLIAMFLPILICLWWTWPAVDRRLLWASGAIVIASTPLAYLSELRSVFLVPAVVLAFVAVSALRVSFDPAAKSAAMSLQPS